MHVLDPDLWFIFNLHRELFYSAHTHKNQAGVYLLKESNLLGKAISCSSRQIPYLLRSLAVRYAARTGQNGHEHSVSARLDAVFIEL